jgi:hypothetical protein
LHNHDELIKKLTELDQSGQNVILIGVTFALLDLIENISFNCETPLLWKRGERQAKRNDRDELHQQLCKGFGVSAIHSEYGMTELLAPYSLGEGVLNALLGYKF